jgi:hypothetical protein
MSTKVNVNTEIRNSKILKDTLEQLKIKCNEDKQNEIITIQIAYNNMIFDLKNGHVSYDSGHKGQIDNINRNYQKNLVLMNANKNNHVVESVNESNDGIIITLSY